MQTNTKETKPLLTDTAYNFLKWLALVFLPASSTFYFVMAGIWNFPNPEQVVGTIAALCTFLGIVLGLSTKTYNNSSTKYDGSVLLNTKEDGTKVYTLEVNGNLDDIGSKDQLVFKMASGQISED